MAQATRSVNHEGTWHMFEDARPIFVQLAEQLEDDVLRGVYAEEAQVPSTNELAAFLRINPATAGKALNRLVDAGVLYKRRGIGMFVSAGAKALIGSQRQGGFVASYVEPLVAEARNLGLSSGDVIRLVENAGAWGTADPETPVLHSDRAQPGSGTAATPNDLDPHDHTAKEAVQ